MTLHRTIRNRFNSLLLKQRVSNLLNCIEVELIGEVSTDGIGVWRVFGCFADVFDRDLAGADASEGPVELLCRNLDTVCKIYRKFLFEAVNDKIKQILFSIWSSVWARFTLRPNRHFL